MTPILLAVPHLFPPRLEASVRLCWQPSLSVHASAASQEDAYGAHNYHPLDVVVESAEGAWVTDVEGVRGAGTTAC